MEREEAGGWAGPTGADLQWGGTLKYLASL